MSTSASEYRERLLWVGSGRRSTAALGHGSRSLSLRNRPPIPIPGPKGLGCPNDPSATRDRGLRLRQCQVFGDLVPLPPRRERGEVAPELGPFQRFVVG